MGTIKILYDHRDDSYYDHKTTQSKVVDSLNLNIIHVDGIECNTSLCNVLYKVLERVSRLYTLSALFYIEKMERS